ncbi:MAG: type II secretion system protein, partial [Candidatus Nanoperiomorbaceae bacterium]
LRHSSGFTIIEVALVLAIAGLIFLVVFIAWPALQNSQRDAAKRQAVGRAAAAMQTYEVDNGGVITPVTNPTSGADYVNASNLAATYIGKLPAGLSVVTHSYVGAASLGDSDLETVFGAICGPDATSTAAMQGGLFTGNTNSKTGKTANHVTDAAVAVKLSSGSYYCQDI